MLSEVKKYLPENTAPNEFMRPPTEPLQPAIQRLSHRFETKINHHASILLVEETEKKKLTSLLGINRRKQNEHTAPITPGLRIGSELEILLFSPNSTPHLDKEKPATDNPNYTPKHIQKVQNAAYTISGSPGEGGLHRVLEQEVDVTKLFIEIRTHPGTVSTYEEAMTEVQQWFRANGNDQKFHPVVVSQHFHLSLTGDDGMSNLYEIYPIRKGIQTGVVDAYHRALPFVRLPEDLSDPKIKSIGRDYGIQNKGMSYKDDPYRLEGRVTNSEYAFDPHLNLLVHLIGIYRGLVAKGKPKSLHKDYPLRINSSQPSYDRFIESPHFNLGEGHTDYFEALEHILEDQVLPEYIPEGLLHQLHDTLQCYWDISEGKLSTAEARKEAYRLAGKESTS